MGSYQERRDSALQRHHDSKISAMLDAAAAHAHQEAGDPIELRAVTLGVLRWTAMLKRWSVDEWTEFFMAGGQYRIAAPKSGDTP